MRTYSSDEVAEIHKRVLVLTRAADDARRALAEATAELDRALAPPQPTEVFGLEDEHGEPSFLATVRSLPDGALELVSLDRKESPKDRENT
jgi:hypothetical protein